MQNSQPAFKYNVSDNYYDVFVYEGSKRIARVRINSMGTATKETFINDYQGSPVAVIADDQTIKYQQYNDPWGNMEMSVGVPTSNPEFKYTDKELDEDSGLYYFQARYYDPMGGRFLGRDKVHLEDAPDDYLQLNTYQFCANNPVRNLDPDGRKLVLGKYVMQNPKVVAEMKKLNQAIIDKGYDDNKFTLTITGGDRYKDFFDQISSKTDNSLIPQSAPESGHLEEQGAIGVDFVARGVSDETVISVMREKTNFSEKKGGYVTKEYPKAPHIHGNLPRTEKFQIKFPEKAKAPPLPKIDITGMSTNKNASVK